MLGELQLVIGKLCRKRRESRPSILRHLKSPMTFTRSAKTEMFSMTIDK